MRLLSKDPDDLWLHRRRLAYAAMVGLFMTACTAAFRNIAAPQSDVMVAAVYAFAGIVGAYTGFAVMDEVSRRKTEVSASKPPKIEPIGAAPPEN